MIIQMNNHVEVNYQYSRFGFGLAKGYLKVN